MEIDIDIDDIDINIFGCICVCAHVHTHICMLDQVLITIKNKKARSYREVLWSFLLSPLPCWLQNLHPCSQDGDNNIIHSYNGL